VSNHVEGSTSVPLGSTTNLLVYVDGYEVKGIIDSGKNRRQFDEKFLHDLPAGITPEGGSETSASLHSPRPL
jgi:hypothetical protein